MSGCHRQVRESFLQIACTRSRRCQPACQGKQFPMMQAAAIWQTLVGHRPPTRCRSRKSLRWGTIFTVAMLAGMQHRQCTACRLLTLSGGSMTAGQLCLLGSSLLQWHLQGSCESTILELIGGTWCRTALVLYGRPPAVSQRAWLSGAAPGLCCSLGWQQALCPAGRAAAHAVRGRAPGSRGQQRRHAGAAGPAALSCAGDHCSEAPV